MIKFLYGCPSDIISMKELSASGYISLGIVSEKKDIIKIIEKLLSNFNSPDQTISKIKCDDTTLQMCSRKLRSKIKTLYPMKSSGFLYFKSAELHIKINEKQDINMLLANWGHYDDLTFFVCDEKYASSFINHLNNILYSNREDIENGKLSKFNLIISQSGDENEVEIVFPIKSFEFMQSQLNVLLKTILFKPN